MIPLNTIVYGIHLKIYRLGSHYLIKYILIHNHN